MLERKLAFQFLLLYSISGDLMAKLLSFLLHQFNLEGIEDFHYRFHYILELYLNLHLIHLKAIIRLRLQLEGTFEFMI